MATSGTERELFSEPKWQFGLRHLLIATTLAGAAAALLAPWARGWTAQQWMWLAVAGGLGTGTFALGMVLGYRQLRHAAVSVGALRYEVRFVQTGGSGCSAVTLYIFVVPLGFLLVLIFFVSGFWISQSLWWLQLGNIGMNAFAAGINLVIGVRVFTHRPQLSAGENGLYNGFNCWPWKSALLAEVVAPDRVKLKMGRRQRAFEIEVSPEAREYVLERCAHLNDPRRAIGG